ncbi:hypothetical protein DRO55_02320 [Candidatus Bathyarchaeota archaeon]|nr:MAG: hypothetical protein DRO55_02320 [Candidatus Bathyarchaeota archaeon]
MFDIVTVGHFAVDLITSPRINEPKPTLGGPPTYVSLAAIALGAEVSVISKVGGDFPREYIRWLRSKGVNLSTLMVIKDAKTTRFRIDYTDGERTLKLESRAPPIGVEDIPNDLKAKAVHVSPIANEVSSKVIGKARDLADTLSIDPQGLVRSFRGDGTVYLTEMRKPKILGKADIYKSSMDEVRVITQQVDLGRAVRRIHKYGVRIVIVTMGRRGSILSIDGKIRQIPTYEPREVVDTTGAGDAFIGAFLAEYIRGEEPIWCACVGSASASILIENVGPSNFGGKNEIYERAGKLYEMSR